MIYIVSDSNFLHISFDVNKSIITALLSSTIGSGGATLLGKTVVSNLLKFIPSIGTIGGGAISAGAAGVITAALGEAYIGIMEIVFIWDRNFLDGIEDMVLAPCNEGN